MANKRLALLLVLAMTIMLFAGCGNSESSATASTGSATAEVSTQDTATAENTTEEETVAEAATSERTPTEAVDEAPSVTISYPVTEETQTYTFCYAVFSVINMMLENGYTDAPFYEAFEEATGVSFEIEQMDTQTYTEKLQLMIASDSLPDLVNGLLTIYTNGASQALEEEVIIDIAPYLDEYAPDYKAAIEAFDGGMASVTTDDGKMGAIYEIYSTDNAYSNGYFIRDDMLKATGLPFPETLDDLLEVAKAMRSNGVDYPLYVNSDGDETGILIDLWFNQWGYMDWYWDVDTQHVEYSHVQDYTLDYVQWLREAWQAEAFLSSGASDVMGMTQSFNDLFKTDAVAIFTGKASTIDEELASLSTPTSVTALSCFTGDYTEQGELMSITGESNVSISANCDDPETLIMALNYLYTKEGAFMNEYGIEGLSYEPNENGEPRYTDIIMSNPNVAQRFALAYYTNPSFPGLTDPYAISYSWSTYAQDASSIWRSSYTGNSATFDESLITLTADEQDIINMYMTDLDTRCTEVLYTFVYGDTVPTEEAFQSFVNDCYATLHLQDVLDIYTEAWLRYQNRSA